MTLPCRQRLRTRGHQTVTWSSHRVKRAPVPSWEQCLDSRLEDLEIQNPEGSLPPLPAARSITTLAATGFAP